MTTSGLRRWLRSILRYSPVTESVTGTPSVTAPPQTPPLPPAPKAARPPLTPAERPGVIYRSDYMPPEREAKRFTLDCDGLPTGYLARRAGQLVLLADGGSEEMVNSRSTRVYGLGIYMFRVKGVSHYEAAVRSGDFSPGAAVRLVRQPDNAYDPNAVAVYAAAATKPAGYVNRQNAARIAKRLDAGDDLAAISLDGSRAGSEGGAPVILVASPAVLTHLMRNL